MTHQEAGRVDRASATTSASVSHERYAVAVLGSTVLLFGIALIVLPGPAFV